MHDKDGGPVFVSGDNRFLELAATRRRELLKAYPDLRIQYESAPTVFAWPSLIVIGQIVVGAIAAAVSAKQQQNISDALRDVSEGVDALRNQVSELQQTLDQIVTRLTNLVPEIHRIVDESAYRTTLQTYLALAQSANQNILTFMVDPVVAWQRIETIEDSLSQLQDSVNVIVAAGGLRLDAFIQVTPLFCTWATTWDSKERLYVANKPGHIVTWARDHVFFKDTKAALDAFFTYCAKVDGDCASVIQRNPCPNYGDSPDFWFDFDRANGRFSAASYTRPRADYLRWESSPTFGSPLKISQMRNLDMVWKACAVRANGSYVPNPDAINRDFAFAAYSRSRELLDFLRKYFDTRSDLRNHAQIRRDVMASLDSL